MARDAGASTKAARRLHKAVLGGGGDVVRARARNWARLADVQAEVREQYEELRVAEAKLARSPRRVRAREAAAREDAVHASVLPLRQAHQAPFFLNWRNSARNS